MNLYKCPLSRNKDGKCRFGGLKTVQSGMMVPFCHKKNVEKFTCNLKRCPKAEKVTDGKKHKPA